MPYGEDVGGYGELGLKISPLEAAHGLQVPRCLEPLAVDEEEALVRPQAEGLRLLAQREHPGVQRNSAAESRVLR